MDPTLASLYVVVPIEKVPLPNRKEGSLSCCGGCLVNFKVMIGHEIHISLEADGCMAIDIDQVNQPFCIWH